MFPPPVITGQSRLSRKMAEKVSENEIPNCTDTTGISSFYEGATLTALGSTFALNNLQQKWINTLGYNGNHMILLGLEVHCYKRCFAIMKKTHKKNKTRKTEKNTITCLTTKYEPMHTRSDNQTDPEIHGKMCFIYVLCARCKTLCSSNSMGYEQSLTFISIYQN